MRTGSAPPVGAAASSLPGSSSSSSAATATSSSSPSRTSSMTASSSGSGGSSASGAMTPGSFGSVAASFVLTIGSYLVGFLCRIRVHQTLQLAHRRGGGGGIAARLGGSDLIAEAAGLPPQSASANGGDAVGDGASAVLLRVLAQHTACHPVPELLGDHVNPCQRVVTDRRQGLRGPAPERMHEIGDDVLGTHVVG